MLSERMIDLVADETGLDPLVVRRRNFIQPDQFPYTCPTNPEAVFYDSGDYPAGLDALVELLDYDGLIAEQKARNADLSQQLMGIGLSTWVEIASFGPNGALEGFGHLASWESAHARMNPDGSVIIASGVSPHGQGNATAFSQIAADELGIDFDQISVRFGDTETIPQGIGTMGSRAIALCGDAVKGTPSVTKTWAEVAFASYRPLDMPEGSRAGELDVTVFNEVPNFTYPSGAYGCVVGIDRDTGEVTVERYVCVDDCGNVINPLLARGQVHGGVAQGIAQALYEHFTYDENGQPQTSTLVDYLVPAATELPDFEEGRVSTPTPCNSLGAKGIGESGSVGSPPAVVNAVVDALSDRGVRHLDMPLTPEKVWNAMNESASQPPASPSSASNEKGS
jgi:carbon-monoxide dehydrogenase large subunit